MAKFIDFKFLMLFGNIKPSHNSEIFAKLYNEIVTFPANVTQFKLPIKEKPIKGHPHREF